MLLLFEKFSSEPQKYLLNAANIATVKGSPEELGFNTWRTLHICIFVYQKHCWKNGQTNENTSIFLGEDSIMHASALFSLKNSHNKLLGFQNI